MSTVLLVDGLPLVYQQFHSVGFLQTSAGESTGLRFGFIRAIRSYLKRTSADRVFIAWDTPGKIQKAEGVTDYKANREATDEKKAMYAQIPDLKKLLDLTCWTQLWADGFEADDIIGTASRLFEEKGHVVYVISVDNDFCQLVSERVKILVPGKKTEIKDRDYVLKKYGVEPNRLLYYRAVIGDGSDNLPGLNWDSVGKSEMLRILKEKEESRILTFLEGLCSTTKELLLLRSNLRVMALQNPGESLVIKKGEENEEALYALLTKLEMKSLLAHTREIATGRKT